MPIRPIDFQNIIPKTQQMSKNQQNQNNKHKNFIHGQIVKQDNQVRRELKQVKKTNKSESLKVNRDGKNSNGSNQSKKEKDKQKEDKEKGNKRGKYSIGSNIDIKI